LIAWVVAVQLAVSALVNSLEGHSTSVALHTGLVSLLPGGKRAVLPSLLRALESDKSLVRWNVVSAIRFLRLPADEVTPKVIDLLTHENPGVRWNACFLAGELGPGGEEAIPSLIHVVEDERAGAILQDGGAVSAARFYDVLKDHSVRSAAAEALGKMGPIAEPAVPALLRATKDANPFVRLDSAIAIWKIEGNSAPCVPVFIGLLTQRWETRHARLLRAATAEALGEIGPDARQAIPALIQVLTSGEGEARDQAVGALGKMGPVARAAEPELLKALNEEDAFFRIKVAEALARIGGPRTPVIWALVDVVKDASHPPFARELAMQALESCGPRAEGSTVALIEARSDSNPLVSGLAGEVLASLAPESSRNPVATLNAAMTSKDPHLRVVAAEGLWRISGQAEQAIPVLVEALTAQELLARRWAARALGDAKPEYGPVVLPALRDRLKDSDLQVRVFAAEAIWNVEGKSDPVVPALLEVLKDRNNPGRARERAAYALGRIGPAAREAVPALRQAKSDEACWDVHVAAMRALERILPPSDAATTAAQQGAGPRVIPVYPPR
jgi:HEAT repeat protein